MPRTPRHALWFLLGFWLSLVVLGPIFAPRAHAAEPPEAPLEDEIHRAVNAFRRAEHLVPLERREALDAVARAHSADMARRGYLAHRSPEGADWVDRLRAAGVDGFAMAGENVGLTSRRPPAQELVEGWKASPVHRENLTARFYNATGIGVARAADGTIYATQLYVTFPRDE